MMKKAFFLVIFLSAVISLKAQRLIDGESLDNIQIGKSTIQDVIANYGAGYKLKKFTDYSNALVYEKLGLIFYSCQVDPKQEIFAILMQPPFEVRTSKGIILGKSKIKDLYEAYGKWNKTSAGFEYEELGLYFDTDTYVFDGFEKDNMNFARARKTGIESPTPAREEAVILSNNNYNASNNNSTQNDQSNNNSLNQNNTRNNNANSSKSESKNTEEEEFNSEMDSWGNKTVKEIELIEKGRLRQCHVDFKTQN